MYLLAYIRLSPQSPVPVSEIFKYHDRFELPYSIDSTIDMIRSLESDDLKARAEKANTKPKKGK